MTIFLRFVQFDIGPFVCSILYVLLLIQICMHWYTVVSLCCNTYTVFVWRNFPIKFTTTNSIFRIYKVCASSSKRRLDLADLLDERLKDLWVLFGRILTCLTMPKESLVFRRFSGEITVWRDRRFAAFFASISSLKKYDLHRGRLSFWFRCAHADFSFRKFSFGRICEYSDDPYVN